MLFQLSTHSRHWDKIRIWTHGWKSALLRDGDLGIFTTHWKIFNAPLKGGVILTDYSGYLTSFKRLESVSYTMRPQFTMRKGDKEAFKKAALSVKSIQGREGVGQEFEARIDAFFVQRSCTLRGLLFVPLTLRNRWVFKREINRSSLSNLSHLNFGTVHPGMCRKIV